MLDELKIFKAKTDDLAKYEEAKALIEPEAEANDPFEGVAEEEETAPEKEAPAPETSDGDDGIAKPARPERSSNARPTPSASTSSLFARRWNTTGNPSRGLRSE